MPDQTNVLTPRYSRPSSGKIHLKGGIAISFARYVESIALTLKANQRFSIKTSTAMKFLRGLKRGDFVMFGKAIVHCIDFAQSRDVARFERVFAL